MEATGSACKRRWARVLSSVHAISTTCSLVLDQPVCSMLVYYIQAWHSSCVHVCIYFCDFLWPEVQPSTFWWQSNACNCSMFCACTRSGLPHNVVHFVVYEVLYLRPSMATDRDAWIYRSLSRERPSHDLSLWHSALLPSCQSIILRLRHSALRGKEEIMVSDSENKAYGCHLQGESPSDRDEYEEI